ncbi:hypothetical protein KDA_59280 [Dictyobacter alpinus]|uniref:T4 RNA ligase 1-like N-terminal domain-containing protein n=1 Tax=Dictyobacter alpinus TaxID=2014873 RepID=A0A402BGB4_9CHLR|nr:T4 RnlA family RNA ligase [Dictyobacter alpinus]GCE30444.1 hypothetical protein KDA_59280 [Dictyobacter alpinus]
MANALSVIDVASFQERRAQGLITGRPHSKHDLIIWNYTPKCQYEQAWDEVTLQARGLITEPDGTIIARPFRKFMNMEQHEGPLPLEPFKATEKMDGSLLIVSTYKGERIVATRGSFNSDQALKANEIIEKRYRDFAFLPAYTYLFEVIYPGNRIVVDYGKTEDITLLALIHTATGEEKDIHQPEYATSWPFPIVKYYDGITDIAVLRQLEEANKEGFVLRFESGLRLKVKFAEYLRLHRLMTQINARILWELLKDNEPLEPLLDRVPDEFYTWVKQTCADLQAQFQAIEQECRFELEQVKDLPTRKEQAAIIATKKYRSVIFSMLDNKKYQDAIWKIIYPAASRPFKIDDEL